MIAGELAKTAREGGGLALDTFCLRLNMINQDGRKVAPEEIGDIIRAVAFLDAFRREVNRLPRKIRWLEK